MMKVTLTVVLGCSLLLAGCAREEAPVAEDARQATLYEGSPEEASRHLAAAELLAIKRGLADANPADDAYLRLAQSQGGFTALNTYMRENAANPAAVQALFARAGVGIDLDAGGRLSAQDINACERYFPAEDRNRSHFFLLDLMTSFIDGSGRPTSAAKIFTPFGIGARQPGCQTLVGNLFGLPGSAPQFQGGHLIASTLGGYGGRANLAPQNSNFNQGVWRETEKAIKSCQNLGPLAVAMTTRLGYPDPVTIIPRTWDMSGTVTNSTRAPRQIRRLSFDLPYVNEFRGGTTGPAKLDQFRASLQRIGCGRLGVSLVVDDTGSMTRVLNAIASSLAAYITATPVSEDVTTHYALTTFKDDVTPLAATTDRATILAQVGALRASGGNDCPENALGGLSSALRAFDGLEDFDNVPKDVILATDASAQDGDVDGLIAAAQDSGTRVNVLLTGDCGLPAPILSAMRLGAAGLSAQALSSQVVLKRIAEETGGKYFYIPGGTAADFSGALDDIFAGVGGAPKDTEPPVVTVASTPTVLWPPNHQMVDLALAVTATDAVDPAPVVELVGVRVGEPDDGQGDGNTTADVRVGPAGQVAVRAERSAKGNGRVYTVTYRATDAAGNTGYGSVDVVVPKSMGN